MSSSNRAQQILYAREQRRILLDTMVNQANVVTVKANVPGENKLKSEGALLVRHFAVQVSRLTSTSAHMHTNDDGRCAIFTFDANPTEVKKATVLLEDTHPLGRFVDIDVRAKGKGESMSRGTMRKCFVCEKPAFVCGRIGAHSTNQLISALASRTKEYFSLQLAQIIKDSMLAELNLENKFGLVTPTSKGSHPDMDYNLMVSAQDAIVPYLVTMFWQGFDCTDVKMLLEVVRPTGIKAEKAMNVATNGVNAYKGLIFVAGLLLASAGYTLANDGDENDLYGNVKIACKNILKEFDYAPTSYGVSAFKQYGIGGARYSASLGFTNVKDAVQHYCKTGDLLKTLVYIVGNTDDTVLLKRSGSLKNYQTNKQLIANVNVEDVSQLSDVNQICLQRNLSVGGSADVLVATVLISKLKELFYFNFFK